MIKPFDPHQCSPPKSGGQESLGPIRLAIGAGSGDARGDGIGGEGVFDMGGGEGLATSCVSCCSCAVKATRVVLMLFLETFCLSVSS